MHPGSKLSFLIVGTGRSGTVYLARLLTGVGIPCSHERVFNGNDIDDAIRALEAPGGKNSECSRYFGLDEHTLPLAESSYMAVPFLLHPWLADAAIIHVVRDPLCVIRSFLNNIRFFQNTRADRAAPAERFIRKHLPHLDVLPDPVSRACYYYLRWNQMIEESIGGRRYLLHRIENGPEPLLAFLGVDSAPSAFNDSTCNAYAKWPDHMRVECDQPAISDEEITTCFLWKEVASLAHKFGYPYSAQFTPELNRTTEATHLRLRMQVSDSASSEPMHAYPAAPQLIEANYHGYNLVQYRRDFMGAHQTLGPVDLPSLSDQEKRSFQANGQLLIDDSAEKVKLRILASELEHTHQTLKSCLEQLVFVPNLLEDDYRTHRIFYCFGRYLALSRDVALTDLGRCSPGAFNALMDQRQVLEDTNLELLLAAVRSVKRGEQHEPCAVRGGRWPSNPACIGLPLTPRLLEQGYREFNLVAYRSKVLAIAQSVGPLDLTDCGASDFQELLAQERLFVGATAEQAKIWIDTRAERCGHQGSVGPASATPAVGHRHGHSTTHEAVEQLIRLYETWAESSRQCA